TLEPAENFKDRSIETPLKVNGPGAYFVEMQMENGNSACIVAWVQDVMIATKALAGSTWYYVADARTGKAIPGARLEFTGWRKEWLQNQDSRRRDLIQVFKNEIAARCDENGTWTANKENFDQRFQYFISAKRPGGERVETFFGMNQSRWYFGSTRRDDWWDQISAYGMTDRPIYRPEQTVHYKFWLAQALYDLQSYWKVRGKNADGSEDPEGVPEPMEPVTMANADLTLIIHSPNGDDIQELHVKTNEYGGLSGDFELAKDAKLGQYMIAVWDTGMNECFGRITFRMEEYRKPEFEVKVDAPKEPVILGETMKVGITAKYYFGAPVANGTVKYRVLRERFNSRWYAPAPWDWLYGSGYWWLAEDYVWFPGWRRWGCEAPIPVWYRSHGSDEELVLEGEIKLTSEMEGKAEITLDTSLAAALYGNSDHRYRIEADVEDASRRVISGSGTVLAARSPFKVNVWARRAWLEIGDQIPVSFAAKTLDGKPVKGSAKVHVFELSYDEKGTPNQKEIQTADLVLSEDGMANYTLKATHSGQFRIACVVTSEGEKPKTIEGATIITVRGKEFAGSDLRFNELEIIPDRSEYQPGDVMKLMINTNQPDATVVLFERAQDGVCSNPRFIQMNGKSQLVELPVRRCDQPNFFIEALTTAKCQVYAVTKEICVPPEKRILNLEVIPSKDRFLPGEKAEVTVRLTDQQGKPFVGETVLTVYDKSLEYISGGSNISDIYRHFWSWKRSHYPETRSTTFLNSSNMQKPNSSMMTDLGGFWNFQVYGELRSGFGLRLNHATDVFLRKAKRRMNSFRGRMLRAEDADEDGAMMVEEEAVEEMAMDAAPMAMGSVAPAPAAAPMMEKAAGMAMANGAKAKQSLQSEMKKDGNLGSDKAKEEKKLVAATIRKNFADTAFWSASLVTNEKGEARVDFPMPENLTTWKVCAWAMGEGTRVGKAEAEVVTAKNLILRMQTPRFITTSDELLLTANVHNYLATEKEVVVSIDLGDSGTAVLKSEKTVSVMVPPKGESRVDWLVRAENEGKLVVTMTAQTDEESDAMQLSVPVQIHGMAKQDARSGMIPSAKLSELKQDSATMEFTIPEARRPKDSALEIRYSPTLAGAILDAIPYLVEYPYGCTEQTLNRFLPAVLARKALTDAGVDLEEISEQTNNLNAQEIGDPKKRAEQWKKLHRDRSSDPVFNEEKFHEILSVGVDRLVNMQCSDGGWGWFSGSGEHSTPHLTALVTRGLLLAQQTEVFGELENSEAVARSIQSGISWLMREQREEVAALQLWVEYYRWLESWKREHRDPKHPEVEVHPKREEIPAKYRDADMKAQASEMDVLVFATLAQAGVSSTDMNEMSNFIFRDRVKLSTQSNALAGIAFFQRDEKDRFRTIFEYLSQFLVRDPENQTAHLSLPSFCYWWYWYGNDIETQAAYLRLLCIDGKPESLNTAAWIVKYLLNNRKNATYWDSTRDTAQVLEAFTQYLRTTNELAPQMKVDVLLDGEVKKTVEITPENLFTADLTYLLEGEAVTTGTHKVELRRTGAGPLYFNGYARYFTL
ncbi:MAG: alpha-2-macroglobulin, partial [Thermoguttaceae bacterium]|nr:alpha-2-macroglobulin [Thermoguttaceae bacterium]